MTNPRDEKEETSSDIVLIFEDDVESDSDHDEEKFVFRRRGQSEEEPLQLDIALKKTHSCDDHTDDTCDETSRASSHQTHEGGEELGLPVATEESQQTGGTEEHHWLHDLMWLSICFVGIMASFVAYGIILEYATSGDRRLHERTLCFTSKLHTIRRDIPIAAFLVSLCPLTHSLTPIIFMAVSFLFVTSVLATITAWVGRTVKGETVTDIPANRFLALGIMSIGSTFCAIRSLRYVGITRLGVSFMKTRDSLIRTIIRCFTHRYVIFPIQVLARSCKPVPVLLIGTLLGKKYPRRKYISVLLIVCGVAMFMGGGNILKGGDSGDESGDSYDPTGAASSDSYDTSYSSAVDIDDEKDEIAPIHQQIFGVALLISSLLLISFNQLHLFVEMLHQTGICKFGFSSRPPTVFSIVSSNSSLGLYL